MEELYAYMKQKQKELYENGDTGTVIIDTVRFMELLKTVCYMRQIKYILVAEDNGGVN